MKTYFDKITDLMEEKELLAMENKYMAIKLKELGYTEQDISNICTGKLN